MTTLERIEHEYKEAFKAHNTPKVNMLRMVKAAYKNAEIEARHDLSDAEVMAVLQKEAKRRRESIAMFAQGGRTDLVAQETEELKLLELFLPAPMSDADLNAIVKAVVDEMQPTPKDFGKVMSAVMAKTNGQADGGRVSAIVKSLLQG